MLNIPKVARVSDLMTAARGEIRGRSATRRTAGRLRLASLAAFAVAGVAMFMPAIVEHLVSPQIVILAAFLGLILLNEVMHKAEAVRYLALVIYLVIAYVAVASWFAPEDVSAAQLIFLLVPVVLVAARTIARSKDFARYLQVLVWLATLNAVIAIFERLTATTVFGQDAFLMVSGAGKGIAAADHPLILGVMLAGSIFLTRPALGTRGVFLAPVLAAGAWSTNAVGPTAIAAVALVCVLVPALVRFLGRHAYLVGGLVTLVWLALAYFVLFVWNTSVPALNPDEYSNQYRTAMYSLVPRILADAPFGYGPAGLPLDVYTFETALRGEKDLGKQIDSELVFLIADFGWLGLIAFAAAFAVGIRGLRRQPYVALAALAVTGSGFFLSLHAWGSSMTMWVLLLGFALWVPTDGDVGNAAKANARRGGSREAASNDER